MDTTGENAMLRLVALDLAASEPRAVEKALPLGFASAASRRTALFDLIAADGRLYALVTQSDRLWVRDPRWQAQHVVTLHSP